MTTFAGFEYPRAIPTLPKGTPAKRLEAQRKLQAMHGQHYKRVAGPYTQGDPAPLTGKDDGRMFYLDEAEGMDGDFQPGLRWTWADEVEGVGRSIDHTGWWADDHESDKIRGMVFRLNHGRGFIAGWSMGAGMIGNVEYDIYDEERTAAYAADRMAERAAEDSREADEEYRKEQEAIEKAAEEEQAMRDAVTHHLETAGWV